MDAKLDRVSTVNAVELRGREISAVALFRPCDVEGCTCA